MHIIFDLDGVITSEQTYWDTVSHVLDRIVSRSSGRVEPLPLRLVAAVKRCAVNSNWDLAYLVLCCQFLAQYSKQCANSPAARLTPLTATGFDELAEAFNVRRLDYDGICQTLTDSTTLNGFALLEKVGIQLDSLTGNAAGNFTLQGPAYKSLHLACQRFHDEKFQSEVPIGREQPSVELVPLRSLLARLKFGGHFSLGIATGRSRKEALRALKDFALESFFCPERIVCYDDVTKAEQSLKEGGIAQSLTKPNPYSILRAVYPEDSVGSIIDRKREPLSEVFYIGDGVSDVLAAKAAGAISVGVLTGIPDIQDFRSTRKQELLSAGCDVVVPTVLDIEQALAQGRS